MIINAIVIYCIYIINAHEEILLNENCIYQESFINKVKDMELCTICKLVLLLTLMLSETITAGADISSKSNKENVKPVGHLKKLGSHRDPLGVTIIGKFSMPAVFYGHFVKPGKPLWMKSALTLADHPGLTIWTDTFLKNTYGSETVKVENSKKENRKSSPSWLTFRQFLSLYKTEDIYMVQTLQNKMEDLALIPASLHCGGFQKAIQEAVMWMGSGNTMSVLHQDDLDNLLCLLDGQKDFVLIDKVYKQEVEADGFDEDGGYSKVNVAKVDLLKFPQLASVPWHEVHLGKGDCIFIPKGWYHQVNSNKHRHLAINLWFSHLLWFNTVNCSSDQDFYKLLEPISRFGFATPNEVYRSKLLEKVHDKGILLKHVFVSSLDASTEERRRQFFDAIDRHKDSILSWQELYDFDIDKAVVKFPDIFGLPGFSPSSTEEKVILYEPLIPVDNNLENNKNPVLEDTHDEIKEQEGGILSDDSQDLVLNLASIPLPDDPVEIDTSQKEHEWMHHDLYRHNDISESENAQDSRKLVKSEVYSYTESDKEDVKVDKSVKKDEL